MRFPIHRAIASGAWMVGCLLAGCERPQASAPPPPPPEVAVITVTPEDVDLTTELPGRTAGYLVAEIRPQISGLVKERCFEEGTEIKLTDDDGKPLKDAQGKPVVKKLFQIDPAPFQAAYDSAAASVESARKAADRARAAVNASVANVAKQQATVALAQTNRKRYEDLFKDKAVSASERDQAVTEASVTEATLRAVEAQVESDKAAVAAADAAIKQAQAALETARINLSYTEINAPIEGRIGRSNVTEGAMVNAYQTVMATIQKFDPIYVDVPQSTRELLRLKRRLTEGTVEGGRQRGREVKLILEDGTLYGEKATFQFADVSVDPTTGSVILRIEAKNKGRNLLPGMFVRAIIDEGKAKNAIKVPQQAVMRNPKGDPMVMVVGPDSTAQIRLITTERALGKDWIVSSGLAPGDRVIMEGLMIKVRPGMPVRPVKPVGPASPATRPATVATDSK